MWTLRSLLFGVLFVQIVISARPCSRSSPTACCIDGYPYTNKGGKIVSCGRRTYGQTSSCPEGYSCVTSENNRWSVCCPKRPVTLESCSSFSSEPCCRHGDPYTNELGEQVFCGRGATQPACPVGYSCSTHAADRWAVCCPPEPCPAMSDTPCCDNGDPYTNELGEQVFCGRGAPQPACPIGYSCSIDPADRWAVCCLPKAAKPAYVAPPSGYTGLRLQTACLHVDPACAQMSYKRIEGVWYRACDIQRPGCSSVTK
ncbi:progranulin-like [Argopecten irradians]|uniref:progranulin-like n=1 Tax=Argopecten irradians TaxID=31199 RepID=UPI00371BD962